MHSTGARGPTGPLERHGPREMRAPTRGGHLDEGIARGRFGAGIRGELAGIDVESTIDHRGEKPAGLLAIHRERRGKLDAGILAFLQQLELRLPLRGGELERLFAREAPNISWRRGKAIVIGRTGRRHW